MQRSKVERLPADVREWLDREIVRRSFGSYEELATLLSEKGYAISESGIQKYGKKFAQQMECIKLATAQARAVVAETADEAGAMSDALVRVLQQRIFAVLVESESEDIGEIKLANLAKGVAALARTTLSQRQWTMKVSEILDRQKSAARNRIDEAAKMGGLSPEAERMIRQALLEIDPLRADSSRIGVER